MKIFLITMGEMSLSSRMQTGNAACWTGGDLSNWHVPWGNAYGFIRSQEPGQALFEINKGDKYGIINGEGETVLEPDDYDTIEILENGAYYVEKRGGGERDCFL